MKFGTEVVSVLLLLGAACAPTRYAVTHHPVAKGHDERRVWGVAEVQIEPLHDDLLAEAHELGVQVIDHGEAVRISRLPTPSFRVEIHNHGETTLELGGHPYVVDSQGRRYAALVDRDVIAERTMGEALARYPALRIARETETHARLLRILGHYSRAVPLLGETIQVPPGGAWRGALVIALESEDEASLATVAAGGLTVHLDGAHLGAQALDPLDIPFETRGHPEQPCLAEVDVPSSAGHRSLSVPIIDGMVATRQDHTSVLLGVATTRPVELSAQRLRIAAGTLLGTGVVGSVATAGALGGSGHGRIAPAGLAVNALSIVGVGLFAGSLVRHRQALRQYNELSAKTGVCARPL